MIPAALPLMATILKLLDLINHAAAFLTGLIIYHFMEPQEYLTLFKRLELGVYFFCLKKYKSTEQGYFMTQAMQEFNHSKVFANILFPDSKYRLPKTDTYTTKKDEGTIYSADGISKRYLTTRFFFSGKSAEEFDINNSLAFMGVLENFQYLVYLEVLKFIPSEYFRYLESIANEEKEHSDVLLGKVGQDLLIVKWNLKLLISLPLIPVDLLFLKFPK